MVIRFREYEYLYRDLANTDEYDIVKYCDIYAKFSIFAAFALSGNRSYEKLNLLLRINVTASKISKSTAIR